MGLNGISWNTKDLCLLLRMSGFLQVLNSIMMVSFSISKLGLVPTFLFSHNIIPKLAKQLRFKYKTEKFILLFSCLMFSVFM